MFNAKKLETTSTTKKQQYIKNGKVRFRLNIDVRKEMEDASLNTIRSKKVDWILAARVQQQLMLILRNLFEITGWRITILPWIKYITFAVCLYFFTNFSFQIYFSTAEKRHKNKILWHFAKIKLKWISQSNGSIGRPLGFVIDRLNTSASLCRIAPCLSLILWNLRIA